jgi:hypothetical protein
VVVIMPLSLTGTAARLSATAADLAAALAAEEADPLAPLALLDRALDLLEVLSWGMCREPASFPLGGLREIARALTAGPPPGGPGTAGAGSVPGVRVLTPAAGAGHRAGCPRQPGAFRGFEDEVAGVLLGAAVLAETAGVDLDAAIARKLTALQPADPGGAR